MPGVVQRDFIALTCGAQWLSGIPGQNTSLRLTHFLMISLKDTKAAISAGKRERVWLLMKQINSFKERGAYSFLLHSCECDPGMKKQVFLVCHS